MEQYDLIVIGAGPGGYPAAIRAAQLGAKTALIEKQWVGGTCLHCGCIPTKTLIAGAEVYRKILHADTFGIKTGEATIDYSAMRQRKDETVDTLQKGVRQLLKTNKVDLIEGKATFVDGKTLEVETTEGTEQLSANKVIIATGSTSNLPGFLPKHQSIVDSQAFLELEALPESLIVLGGGYIGCELACLAAALGVQVTIVELLEDILLLLDRDMRSEIKRSMKKELGITILTGAALENISITDDNKVQGSVKDETVEADMLLAAIGRLPVTSGLALENAGIELNDKGCIPVDEYCRTSQPYIYAVGDVNGGIQLAHAATSQGMRAAEHACGKTPPPTETLVPGVIFTIPEAATIGVSQQDLESKDQAKTAKFFYRGLGKAIAAGENSGFVKWIADAETGKLIGAQAVGTHATDLIAEAGLAIKHQMTAEDVGNTIHGHPTFSEIWMEAAHVLEGKPTHTAPPRKR